MSYISTHTLARQLLSLPDGFLIAKHGKEEYVISSYERAATCANYDDTSLYWILNLSKCS